jgi:hypothetical protein
MSVCSPCAPRSPCEDENKNEDENDDEDSDEESTTASHSEDNPKGLPLWNTTMGNKNTWKGEAGVLYWHPIHRFQVVGYNNTGKVGFRRACIVCDKMTTSQKETHCAKCGGKAEVKKQCEILVHDSTGEKQCTNFSRYNDAGIHKCQKHYVASNPAERGCPQCQVERKSKSRDDGLCPNCICKNKVDSQRDAQRPALEALMKSEGIEEWPGVEYAQPKTRYAALNKQDGHRPHVVVLAGKHAKKACGERGCCKVAVTNPDTGEYKWCTQHGGGRRCKGANEEVGCPLGRSISEPNSKYHKSYDGLCVKCFCDAFPNDPRAIEAKKWHKAREQEVVSVLKEAFPTRHWILDKGFAKGVLQRPDMRINARHRRIVIVEIDEDSHRSYECAKERAREAVFLANAPLGAEIVMLRFNPDSYEDYDGIKHPSCFKFNPKIGIVTVHPKQRKQWEARCADLIAAVQNYLNPETEVPPPQDDRVIFSAELFYDNISGAPVGDAERARAKFRKLGKMKASKVGHS